MINRNRCPTPGGKHRDHPRMSAWAGLSCRANRIPQRSLHYPSTGASSTTGKEPADGGGRERRCRSVGVMGLKRMETNCDALERAAERR